MNNDIFHITIKHKIYEWCIDVIFKHIFRNFPRKAKRIPMVGEKYIYIKHLDINETYYNCTIVDSNVLIDYDLLEESEKKDIVFAIKYKKLLYITDEHEAIEIFADNEDEGYQYFIDEDMPYLKFKQ